MGINVRPEEQWSKRKKLVAWLVLGVIIVMFASCYAKTMDDISYKYCAGDYNSDQCRKDRELRNHMNYERKKAER